MSVQLSFSAFALSPALLDTLTSLNYHQPTPVQAQSLPAILAGKDVLAQAATGSGKTAAFALGLLSNLDVKRFRVQSLVLCPTRELAEQVATEIRTLARGIHNIKVLTLCGGIPAKGQILSLEHGAHIIVGTPGRVLDHLQHDRLNLEELTMLVLDEADRMLEMGFAEDLQQIIDAMPAQRQQLLFSATFAPAVKKLANELLHSPQEVIIDSPATKANINQQFFLLSHNQERSQATVRLILAKAPQSCVIFANTRKEVQSLAEQLKYAGFSVAALHGDLEQREREQQLLQFANGSLQLLVATDVAARGLDIEKLDLVINFELAHDTDTHIHRIGRTGRAGEQGVACTLYTTQDGNKISQLEEALGQEINPEPLPETRNSKPLLPLMATIEIDGGKKQKLRPADIVGALTRDDQIAFADIGKIQLQDFRAYVAVKRSALKAALQQLNNSRIKGRSFRAYRLGND
ncbi:ATP-dependent RNA helicase DbpA [Alishewanella sp. 16-MA]|uniref:ATP-dependent RNA helicase DbpA n=1 Tax=Alishewanella maricola TaxID=2795740 RepID=A0ABS8BZL3_9ALTE|nr:MULTISPECIES: ATP-dependent RNA helicase DbpA [Alishewanella]MCB5225503.1 ATP-dependent RNA helicase DbpA [Alishewanella maricola]MDP5035107.1 ATP-dependent RNA helicase DbpA [Alishewanella sp.]MDP5188029.1 ATP-dependent RNA helicase DbpA [Alishewanella sp.]MDP5458607.1 ATP-dependent RNA helicase DbpA [Alishewanella sp. SMS8]